MCDPEKPSREAAYRELGLVLQLAQFVLNHIF